jgi:vitamin B12 transporter
VPGTTTTRFGYYANVKQAHAHGLEAGATLRLGRVTASGNYSIVVAQDRTPGATYGRNWPACRAIWPMRNWPMPFRQG